VHNLVVPNRPVLVLAALHQCNATAAYNRQMQNATCNNAAVVPNRRWVVAASAGDSTVQRRRARTHARTHARATVSKLHSECSASGAATATTDTWLLRNAQMRLRRIEKSSASSCMLRVATGCMLRVATGCMLVHCQHTVSEIRFALSMQDRPSARAGRAEARAFRSAAHLYPSLRRRRRCTSAHPPGSPDV
jgi:hypothetical protein